MQQKVVWFSHTNDYAVAITLFRHAVPPSYFVSFTFTTSVSLPWGQPVDQAGHPDEDQGACEVAM